VSEIGVGVVPDPVAASATRGVARRLLGNPLAIGSAVVLVLIVGSAVLAPWLAPHDPNLPSATDVLAAPSDRFLLGADSSGHDILSRLLFATRVTLAAAALALVVAAVLGISAGLMAGYAGGWTETVGTWIASMLMALPGIVALLAARAVVGPSVWATMIVFGVLLSPMFYRVIYTAVSGVRQELFVDAARVAGLSDARIITRHILTVVRAPAVILAAQVATVGIGVQSGLAFLGLGDPTVPSWGGMLNDAFTSMYLAPLQILWPSLAIGTTGIALTLLSNALRDAWEGTTGPSPRRDRRGTARPSPAGRPAGVVHDEAPRDREVPPAELLGVTGLRVGYVRPDGTSRTVVDGVSLQVRRGEVHGLVGESGSGKTQTAFAIMRLLPREAQVSGRIGFDGTDLAELPERELRRLRGHRIGYIPQEPMSNLDPSFTVGSQLVEPIRLHLGLGRAPARARALDLLDRVGLPDPRRAFGSYPHEISGGMAQRVLIAGAVSCHPDLLIADEPTTALDVTVQAEVLDLLRGLQADLGMGILLVTHNFGVVADICDQVSVMRSGRIVETGPVRAIFEDPRHPYTRSLFAAVPQAGVLRDPWVMPVVGRSGPGSLPDDARPTAPVGKEPADV